MFRVTNGNTVVVSFTVAAKTNALQYGFYIGSWFKRVYEVKLWFPLDWTNVCVCRDAVSGRVSLVLGSIYKWKCSLGLKL